MTLVDLRGREDDPAVSSLIGQGTGSPAGSERAADRYRRGDWILLGWEEDGRVVGCVGVERDEQRDIALHSVAVAPDQRGRGVGRALIDALAEVATTRRLVAETDADAAGFYERCGFEVEPIGAEKGTERFRCVRDLPVRAAPREEVSAITLGDLERALRGSWARDTSDDPGEWTEGNPALGHCGVTALMLREYLGGEILIANVFRDGERVGRHGWNLLPSGLAVDLTRCQFTAAEELGEPKVGEPLVARRARDRYELFASRVRQRLTDG